MKDLIKILDEVVMKQVFNKDEYIIAVSRAKSILEKIGDGKIFTALQSLDSRNKDVDNFIRAKSLTNWLGEGK